MAQQLLDQLRHADWNATPCALSTSMWHRASRRTWVRATSGRSCAKKILATDILVFSTPTWVGHMSSVAPDGDGRPSMVGKVALAAVVGNEDGAHKVVADLFQALNDIGFTIPAQGCTYWNGEAMQGGDFNDLEDVPEVIAKTTESAARNAVHAASVLRQHKYPPYK